jgi:hypothetical protein
MNKVPGCHLELAIEPNTRVGFRFPRIRGEVKHPMLIGDGRHVRERDVEEDVWCSWIGIKRPPTPFCSRAVEASDWTGMAP